MTDNGRPLASVIVLAYNDKPYLEECLASLLDQDLPDKDYEVIYADNASTDGSADFVEARFPRVRVVRLDKNYGFAEGNNRAAETAQGRYVAFQNADTIVHRRWLPELARVPDRYIHEPSKMPSGTQREAGCVIGQDYAAPIVDHAWARERVLNAYRQARTEHS